MPFKFGFFAALCVAQAAAAVVELKRTIDDGFVDSDYDILVGCFRMQKGRLTEIAQRLTGVQIEAVQDLQGELRQTADKYMKQVDEAIADMAEASLELYDAVYEKLREGQIKEASGALVEGLKGIDAIYATIGEILLKAAVESPDLADNVEYMLSTMMFEMRRNKATMRERFGACLAQGLAKYLE